MDEDAQERLGVLGVAGADGVFERVGGGVQLGGVGGMWGFCRLLVRDLAVLVTQRVQLGLERFHAPLEALGVQVAVLEGVEVAVDRAFGTLDLSGD
ncbi:MAG TPA: hypothetical protein VFF79_16320 [Conexibacter sp.]|nr:hypothetical protein [Conexibacter sp.]